MRLPLPPACALFSPSYEQELQYCKEFVTYRACLPRAQDLWPNHTALRKDKWVSRMAQTYISERTSLEQNLTIQDMGVNENGHDIPGLGGNGEVVERMTENEDCQNAFKAYYCWMNFPRCDEEDNSLLLCRSVCENYFRACNYHEELWRCGPEEFVNGYVAENEDYRNPLTDEQQYVRAPFPGSPFEDYKEDEADPDEMPLITCTPSIKNSATGLAVRWSVPYFSLVAAVSFIYVAHY